MQPQMLQRYRILDPRPVIVADRRTSHTPDSSVYFLLVVATASHKI